MSGVLCTICGERPATDGCPAYLARPLCRPCHAARRCVIACRCMTADQAIEIIDPGQSRRTCQAAMAEIRAALR